LLKYFEFVCPISQGISAGVVAAIFSKFRIVGQLSATGASFRGAEGVTPKDLWFHFFLYKLYFFIKRETAKMSTALPLQEQ